MDLRSFFILNNFIFNFNTYILIIRPIIYFRLKWIRFNFLLSCDLLYKSKIIYLGIIVTIILNRYWFIINYRWNLSFYKINEFIIIFLLLIAFTKRAQIPFSTWLPIAIITPTPVSSLIRSSTLAGIYLSIRYVDLLDYINIKMLFY